MKNLYHRILKLMNLNGRDWAIFLLTLLLAFSIWLIHNLSLKYSDYLGIPIIAHCDIPEHANVSAGKEDFIIRCNASGYKLIEAYLNKNETVDITFHPYEMRHKEGDIYYVTASDVMSHMNDILGSDVVIEDILVDTLFFRFPVENHKKVPVKPVTTFTFKDQYMAGGELHLNPDSIIVYGEPFTLEGVDAVHTRPIRAYEISENLRGITELENISNVRISDTDVHYSLDVKRYVEIRSRHAVTAVNVPEGKQLHVFPMYLDIAYKCIFPMLEDPDVGLSLYVDYNDFIKSLSGKCAVHADVSASGVISYEMTPSYVSCIVEDVK